jgi:hypothetical protein
MRNTGQFARCNAVAPRFTARVYSGDRAGVARTRDARLIAMVTRGHDQVGDVLLGSHTERVIREAGCPVLSVRI